MIADYITSHEESDSQTAASPVYKRTTLQVRHILFGLLMGLAAAAVCTGIYFMSDRNADKEDIVQGSNQS
jgi:hypothetical protein